MLIRTVLVFAVALCSLSAGAAEVRVAVASNFATTAKQIVTAYEQVSDDRIILLVGSTGKHASQIQHGLQVDVLLAADVARPYLLEQRGLVVDKSRFTYALGQLVLWSYNKKLFGNGAEIVKKNQFRRLAIANPKTAPYGKAALEAIDNMAVANHLERKLVRGESVAQAYQFVRSGNAELGFIALSQALATPEGSYWHVPTEMHAPIEQQAVLINDTRHGRAFLTYLSSEPALEIIEAAGYLRP